MSERVTLINLVGAPIIFTETLGEFSSQTYRVDVSDFEALTPRHRTPYEDLVVGPCFKFVQLEAAPDLLLGVPDPRPNTIFIVNAFVWAHLIISDPDRTGPIGDIRTYDTESASIELVAVEECEGGYETVIIVDGFSLLHFQAGPEE